ncbi:hypothetical protein GUITHDRAFT_101014 [Guillardia theta CCMP2712]|uniref:Uncharacterized protein n=1 Tax=Guillardia theta (strain CCMP2712) TaxID=905079 RepID=L1JYB8_GUITC|nr:hypothetical protein GUITHDRAFT_101014 [Guillardia theta CCMP2712]EKX53309.1 hypothetical protein GUITHDRAFT_101014 [Guillardia theta CCMP2712]|eukprot:XP_005840289.1 hypothetical protein GUITHDRAFT_101014 [Guillardia theta CCMP2712]
MVQVFINTDDDAVINALPGVSSALANRILKARPFNSFEELLSVKEMSLELLRKWIQNGFEIQLQLSHSKSVPRRPPLPRLEQEKSNSRGKEASLSANEPPEPSQKVSQVEEMGKDDLMLMLYNQLDARLRWLEHNRIRRDMFRYMDQWNSILHQRKRLEYCEFNLLLRTFKRLTRRKLHLWFFHTRKKVRLQKIGDLIAGGPRRSVHFANLDKEESNRLLGMKDQVRLNSLVWSWRRLNKMLKIWKVAAVVKRKMRDSDSEKAAQFAEKMLVDMIEETGELNYEKVVACAPDEHVRVKSWARAVQSKLRSIVYKESRILEVQRRSQKISLSAGLLLFRIFVGWRSLAFNTERLKNLGVKCLLRSLFATITRAFNIWKESSFFTQQERGPRIHIFFRCWLLTIIGKHQKRLQMIRLRTRGIMTSLKTMIEQWRLQSDAESKNSKVSVKIAVRWTLMTCKRFFRVWHQLSQQRRKQRLLMKPLARTARARLFRRSFTHWAGRAYARRRRWHAGSVILARHELMMLSDAFSDWWEACPRLQTIAQESDSDRDSIEDSFSLQETLLTRQQRASLHLKSMERMWKTVRSNLACTLLSIMQMRIHFFQWCGLIQTPRDSAKESPLLPSKAVIVSNSPRTTWLDKNESSEEDSDTREILPTSKRRIDFSRRYARNVI